MNDPAEENGQGGIRVMWRLGQPAKKGAANLDSSIVLELASSHGSTLSSVSIPPGTMNELLRPLLSIFAELQLDGSVSLESEFSSALPALPTRTDILQLVSRALAPELLQDEPDAKEQLTTLRRCLTEALALVDRTLADLDRSA